MAINRKMFEIFVGLERFQARLIRRSLEINEGEISYLEGGSGSTLVLIHGFGANKDSWNRLAKKLTRHFHVLAIDLPGFGDSFSPVTGFDIDSQAARVTAFLRQKGIGNCTLLGNSYGGYISAILASKFPDVIKDCILISPLGIESVPLTPIFEDVVNGCSPLLLPANLHDFKRLLMVCLYKAPYIPEFVLKVMLERNLAKGSLHHKLFYQTHLLMNGQLKFDYALEELLTEIKIPIHVIWGDKDGVLSAEGLKVLLGLGNKLITLERLENVGHLPQLEVPNYLSNLVKGAAQGIKISRM